MARIHGETYIFFPKNFLIIYFCCFGKSIVLGVEAEGRVGAERSSSGKRYEDEMNEQEKKALKVFGMFGMFGN